VTDPIVLYVATTLMGNAWQTGHYRACGYYRFLTQVVDALSAASGIRAMLKTHSRADHVYNPIGDYIRRTHAPVALATGALAPWLARAALVVLDEPGTVLLEALAAHCPVLVYVDPVIAPMSADARAALAGAALVETDAARFLARLRGVGEWAGLLAA
jgi:hypothetical protein